MAVIDVLATMGEDALGNHFQVVIPAIDKLGNAVANLNMRILGVTIPEKTINTYEIVKRGRKFERPSSLDENNKDVEINYRIDKYWNCYNSLMNWSQFIQNNETFAMASDSGPNGMGGASEFRHDVEIWSLPNLNATVPNNIWTLKGAWVKEMSSVEFSEESGEPIEGSFTLSCMYIQYPS